MLKNPVRLPKWPYSAQPTGAEKLAYKSGSPDSHILSKKKAGGSYARRTFAENQRLDEGVGGQSCHLNR
jgi:hypothetical protein